MWSSTQVLVEFLFPRSKSKIQVFIITIYFYIHKIYNWGFWLGGIGEGGRVFTSSLVWKANISYRLQRGNESPAVAEWTKERNERYFVFGRCSIVVWRKLIETIARSVLTSLVSACIRNGISGNSKTSNISKKGLRRTQHSNHNHQAKGTTILWSRMPRLVSFHFVPIRTLLHNAFVTKRKIDCRLYLSVQRWSLEGIEQKRPRLSSFVFSPREIDRSSKCPKPQPLALS